MYEFSEFYIRARYPFILRGKVVTPSEYVSEEMAVDAVRKAEGV